MASAVILAAGQGRRFGSQLPKQFALLDGLPVLCWSANALLRHPRIDDCVLVLRADDIERFRDNVEPHLLRPVRIVVGGRTRSESSRLGLAALADTGPEHVLIHDGARPVLSDGLIDRLLVALETGPAAIPALPVHDALWLTDDGMLDSAVDRQSIVRAQTPQAFRYREIAAAHRQGSATAGDDAATARAAGLTVATVAGDANNVKLTTGCDMSRLESALAGTSGLRCGQGYDVHRFTTGDHVVLCGVPIPHDRALCGHSDADVAMHAITDAIYGALADGDIGRWFDPADPQWKDADSRIFLEHAAQRLAARRCAILSVDCTIVCETPKNRPPCGRHAPQYCFHPRHRHPSHVPSRRRPRKGWDSPGAAKALPPWPWSPSRRHEATGRDAV